MKPLIVMREWPAPQDVVTIKTREDAVRYGYLDLYETISREDARRATRPEFLSAAEAK